MVRILFLEVHQVLQWTGMIDYILSWNKPELEGLPFTFWIAPATLIFKSIRNLTFDFCNSFQEYFEIEDIERTGGENGHRWTIIIRNGEIQFDSEGYEQYIRQEPFFQFEQNISFIDRNGCSLERTTNQENPNRVREDVVRQREKDIEDYQNAKKRHLKRQELNQLITAREENQIDTRQYFIKKKEINELLYSYDFFLRGRSLKLLDVIKKKQFQ
jgi:hypothetical protein